MKKAKQKPEKKPPETTPKPSSTVQNQVAIATQQHQPQILTILQNQPQMKIKNEPQQTQQIILSMSQAQAMIQQANQPKGAVYTFPTNLILNNGTFMTNTGEVVGNFKFEGQ